jgi:hypothetical protein
VDLADVLLRALHRLVAGALGVARGLLGGLLGEVARLALDRVGARLGGLDDRLHLRAGDAGQRFTRAARVGGRRGLGRLRSLEGLDLAGNGREVRVDGRRLVAAAADGEISLLDGLTVEGQGASGVLRRRTDERARP